MKKLFTLSLVVLSLLMKAQSWCAPGATWHYVYGAAVSSSYARISYTKDTVINNQVCNVLTYEKEGVRGNFGWPYHYKKTENKIYTHVNNGVVYLGNDTIYSLNFALGTQWRLPKTGANRCQTILTALDTGRINIQGKSLKYMRVTSTKGGYPGMDTILEKIGFLQLFPYDLDNWCIEDCWPEIGGAVRCYSDNGFSYNRSNVACNYYYSTGINQQNLNPAFSLYPNPANHSCFVSLPNTESHLKVSINDLTGALVKEITIQNTATQTHEINLEGLEKGIYFIRLKSNNGTYAPQKLVVNTGR
ncbi:MAG: T9SS type A sorting domain-containing protein [Bacteroidia bacterium]|nr:T9SS type A sorting domain-containing protein [Bacteroidia bacterium]